MTEQITLEEALRLVSFRKDRYGEWYVDVVKGNCGIVEGNCNIVEGTVCWSYNDRNVQTTGGI